VPGTRTGFRCCPHGQRATAAGMAVSVLHSGALGYEGEPRWFVLQKDRLIFYASFLEASLGAKPQGTLMLAAVLSVAVSNEELPPRLLLRVQSTSRIETIKLNALEDSFEDCDDLHKWQQKIQKASETFIRVDFWDSLSSATSLPRMSVKSGKLSMLVGSECSDQTPGQAKDTGPQRNLTLGSSQSTAFPDCATVESERIHKFRSKLQECDGGIQEPDVIAHIATVERVDIHKLRAKLKEIDEEIQELGGTADFVIAESEAIQKLRSLLKERDEEIHELRQKLQDAHLAAMIRQEVMQAAEAEVADLIKQIKNLRESMRRAGVSIDMLDHQRRSVQELQGLLRNVRAEQQEAWKAYRTAHAGESAFGQSVVEGRDRPPTIEAESAKGPPIRQSGTEGSNRVPARKVETPGEPPITDNCVEGGDRSIANEAESTEEPSVADWELPERFQSQLGPDHRMSLEEEKKLSEEPIYHGVLGMMEKSEFEVKYCVLYVGGMECFEELEHVLNGSPPCLVIKLHDVTVIEIEDATLGIFLEFPDGTEVALSARTKETFRRWYKAFLALLNRKEDKESVVISKSPRDLPGEKTVFIARRGPKNSRRSSTRGNGREEVGSQTLGKEAGNVSAACKLEGTQAKPDVADTKLTRPEAGRCTSSGASTRKSDAVRNRKSRGGAALPLGSDVQGRQQQASSSKESGRQKEDRKSRGGAAAPHHGPGSGQCLSVPRGSEGQGQQQQLSSSREGFRKAEDKKQKSRMAPPQEGSGQQLIVPEGNDQDQQQQPSPSGASARQEEDRKSMNGMAPPCEGLGSGQRLIVPLGSEGNGQQQQPPSSSETGHPEDSKSRSGSAPPHDCLGGDDQRVTTSRGSKARNQQQQQQQQQSSSASDRQQVDSSSKGGIPVSDEGPGSGQRTKNSQGSKAHSQQQKRSSSRNSTRQEIAGKVGVKGNGRLSKSRVRKSTKKVTDKERAIARASNAEIPDTVLEIVL